MDENISKKMEQSSRKDFSLCSKRIKSQSDWSRCNSFSSSSEDSTLFCSNHMQPYPKHKNNKEHVSLRPKRSRNSSGSSASSNLSCISDKDLKNMPVLLPSDPFSANVKNIESLVNSITPSLSLQEETMINDELPHPMSMTPILPFRHNLRKNIRKKTCSCDCASSCTTVIVKRQYKGVGRNTVKEKTVITQTKVETYLKRDIIQGSPLQDVQTLSNKSLKESMPKRSERRRRSELEKLYDSLHEIKWAKNFSPDNILQQLDVRQAATSSAFGKSADCKSPRKTRYDKNQDIVCNRSDKLVSKRSQLKRLTLNNQTSSYVTKSVSPRSLNTIKKNKINKNCLSSNQEKSESFNSESLNLNSIQSRTAPILSEKTFINKRLLSSDFNFSSPIQAECCDENDFFSERLNFNNKSPSSFNNLIDNCNDSFFDIAEDDIHSLDACFREVGAEVIVQTCYETACKDNNVPHLTSMEDVRDLEVKSYENPPVLKRLISHDQLVTSDLLNKMPETEAISSSPTKLGKKMFPVIDPLRLVEKEYQPPPIYFDDVSLKEIALCDSEKNALLNSFKTSCNLPSLIFIYDTEVTDQNLDFDHEPPLLELCPDVLEDVFRQKEGKIVKENNSNNTVNSSAPDSGTKNEDSFMSASNYTSKMNCTKGSNSKVVPHSHYFNSHKKRNGSQIIHRSRCKKNKTIKSLSNEMFQTAVEKKSNDDDMFNITVTPEMSYTKDKNDKTAQKVNCLESNIDRKNSQLFSRFYSFLEKKKNYAEKNSLNKTLKNNTFNTIAKMNYMKGNKCIPYLKSYLKTNNSKIILKSPIFLCGRQIIRKYLKFTNSKSRQRLFVNSKRNVTRSKIRRNLNKFVKICNNSKSKATMPCETLSSNLLASKPQILIENFQTPNNSNRNTLTSGQSLSTLLLQKSKQSDKKLSESNKTTNSLFSGVQSSHSNINSVSSFESYKQTTESVLSSSKSQSVIKTFNQTLSFSKLPEQIAFNQMTNSSNFVCCAENPDITHNKAKKTAIANTNHFESIDKTAGCAKASLIAKLNKESTEKTKIPPLTVTHGINYIQITMQLKSSRGFLTHQVLVELKEAILKAHDDKDCKLLLLCGYEQMFCLGLDLRPLIDTSKNEIVNDIALAIKSLIETLTDFKKPVIAVVCGPAFGLGLTLLTHADVVLATNDASFCMPYSKLGYVPEGGATLTLPQAVRASVAMDMLMKGEEISAQQAFNIGLVNEVVEVINLAQIVVSRIKAMAENPCNAMELTKGFLKMSLYANLPHILETETKLLPKMWLSPSCQEAMQAALSTGFFAKY